MSQFNAETMPVVQVGEEFNRLLAKPVGTVRVQVPETMQGMVPCDLEGIQRMAKMYLASGFVPRDATTIEKICVIFQRGFELGLMPSQALDGIAIIQGRVTVWGDVAKGMCYAAGLLEEDTETIEGDGDNRAAVVRVKRKGQTNWHEQRFTVADAKRAGLWGKQGPWSQYPERMLIMRARGFALRSKFPDVLKGLYLSEEADSIPSHTPAGSVNSEVNATVNALSDPAPVVEQQGELPPPVATDEPKPEADPLDAPTVFDDSPLLQRPVVVASAGTPRPRKAKAN